jgi:hypothetical protein
MVEELLTALDTSGLTHAVARHSSEWAAAEAEKAKDLAGMSNMPAAAEASFGVSSNGDPRGDGTTLMLTESGERAKTQNELGSEERHGAELTTHEADAMFDNEIGGGDESEASGEQEMRGRSGHLSVVPPQADKDDVRDDQ